MTENERQARKSLYWVRVTRSGDLRVSEPDGWQPHGWIPELGDQKTFVPSAMMNDHYGVFMANYRQDTDPYVTGIVDYVNETHRWCRVRYETETGPQHECFKF